MLGSAAVIGLVFSAFQAATEWAIVFAIALVIVFAWTQSQKLIRANKLRKLQTQDIAVGLARPNLADFAGDGSFSCKVLDTRFYEGALLALRAKDNSPFFEALPMRMLIVSRPLDRLRKNAVQVYAGDLAIGWLEVEKQQALIELLDSVDGIARVKGKVTFGLKAESHSAVIDLVVAD